MLNALKQHALSTEQWISIVSGLPLYDLVRYDKDRPLVREACDLQLLTRRGQRACELQTERLNELLFASTCKIKPIKNSHEKTRIWANKVMGCLSDPESTSAHRLSCLLFISTLFDLNPPITVAQNPSDALTLSVLIEGNVTLISLYARLFPAEVFDIIFSFAANPDVYFNDMLKLVALLGHIYRVVNDDTRLSIEKVIELMLPQALAHDPADKLIAVTCDMLMKMRHLLSIEKRKSFITLIEATLIDESRSFCITFYAHKTIATLKEVDEPGSLLNFLNNALEETTLTAIGLDWLAQYTPSMLVPVLFNKIMHLVETEKRLSSTAFYANAIKSIAFRLSQDQLLVAAKFAIDRYAEGRKDFEHIKLMPALLSEMNAHGVDLLIDYAKDKIEIPMNWTVNKTIPAQLLDSREMNIMKECVERCASMDSLPKQNKAGSS